MKLKKTFTRFLISVASFGIFSCGKNANSKPRPSFVAIRFTLAGPSSPGSRKGVISSYSMHVADCKNAAEQETVFQGNAKDHTLNLVEGDTGCALTLSQMEYDSGLGKEIFLPASESQKDQTDTVLLQGQKTGNLLHVAQTSKPNSPLNHLEVATFLVLPAALLQAPLSDSVTTFPDSGGTVPILVPTEVIDLGVDNSVGKRAVLIKMECPVPLELSACETQNILDFRFRILTQNESTLTAKSDAQAAIGALMGPIQPNLNHLYRNGLRFTAMLPLTGPVPNLNIVVAFRDGYKIYSVPSTQVSGLL